MSTPTPTSSNFGPFPFQVTSNAAKPKIGTLMLTYTLYDNGTITGASFTYLQDPGKPPIQTKQVTFMGASAPYTGFANPPTMNPPLHVPGEGEYQSASFSFTPPTASPLNAGSLTGSFSEADTITDDDPDISWVADPSVPEPEEYKTAAPGKH
jgi:hypothetical protein